MTDLSISLWIFGVLGWFCFAGITDGFIEAINREFKTGKTIDIAPIPLFFLWPIIALFIFIGLCILVAKELWGFLSTKITTFLIKRWGSEREP